MLEHRAWTFDPFALLESVQDRVIVNGTFSLDELRRVAWEVVTNANGDARQYLDDVILSVDDAESEWEELFGHLEPDTYIAESLFGIAMAPYLRAAPGLSRESVIALRYHYPVGSGTCVEHVITGNPLLSLVTEFGDYRLLQHRWDEGTYGGWRRITPDSRPATRPLAARYEGPLAVIADRLGTQAATAVQNALQEVDDMFDYARTRNESLRLCVLD